MYLAYGIFNIVGDTIGKVSSSCLIRCKWSYGEGNGTPLQYSCLGNLMDGEAWWAACSPWGREESDTTKQLHFHFHALEKEMATHSSVLAWRTPESAEPGGLLSMGSQSQTQLERLSSSKWS